MQVFLNEPWRQMCALLILLSGKTKALFGNDAARKKLQILHMLFLENKRETSKLKWGGGGGWGGCLSGNQKIYLKPFNYKNYEFQYDRRSHNKSKVCAVLRSRVICRNVPLKFIKLSMEKPCLGSSEGHNYGGCILKKTSGTQLCKDSDYSSLVI